jgi:cell division transport system permease protein
MWLKLFRTLKTGIQNFLRNGLLSVATLSVIVITLFIINIQIAITFANNLLLKDVENRVSVSVYFKPDVVESDILKARDEFRNFKEIAEVEYVSKDQALAEFKQRNQENETIRKSIEELGTNPLGATLNIRANDPNEYELIAKSVEEGKYKEIIAKVNYKKYKNVIENLNREVSSNQRVTIILGITLSTIAILITFNSIRITMYAFRQEIEIMRLVGASNTYIRFPFIWEGIIYGLISGVLVIPLILIYMHFVSADTANGSILPFSNAMYIKDYMNNYFMKHLLAITAVQLLAGIFLGVISSMIAIRKYLKV